MEARTRCSRASNTGPATTNKFIVCSGLTSNTRHPLLTLWVVVFVNIDRPKKRWREGKRSLFKPNKNKKGKVEVEGEVMGLAEKVCGDAVNGGVGEGLVCV